MGWRGQAVQQGSQRYSEATACSCCSHPQRIKCCSCFSCFTRPAASRHTSPADEVVDSPAAKARPARRRATAVRPGGDAALVARFLSNLARTAMMRTSSVCQARVWAVKVFWRAVKAAGWWVGFDSAAALPSWQAAVCPLASLRAGPLRFTSVALAHLPLYFFVAGHGGRVPPAADRLPR